MNAHPFNRFSFFKMLCQILNMRTVRLYDRMAVHADIHRRNRCVARFFGPRMTVETSDFVVSRMFLMTERNGLLWGITLIARGGKVVYRANSNYN